MKSLVFLVAFLLVPYVTCDPAYIYLHGGGDDCDTFYSYQYNLSTTSFETEVKFSVNLILRSDKELANALLFYFKDYTISEYANKNEEEPNRSISDYPVRAIFNGNGLIEKLQFDDRESDGSYHLKTGIIRTLQLDWTQIQAGVKSDAAKEFEVKIPGRKGECKAITTLKVRSELDFCVNVARKISDCTHTPPNSYEKFKDSTKKWHFHFDGSHVKNFHHAKVEIEDFYRENNTILIKSGFKFEGCHKYEGEFNTSELKDVERDFVIPK